MNRPAHKVAHPRCPFPTWGACDANWAILKAAMAEESKAREAARKGVRRAEMDARIDAALERRRTHPSVWG